jgi:glycosyltransferase involved in cell wall biosynthesis
MRILFCSHVFAPSVGGIETVSSILAEQFSRLGSTVTVVTNTPGEAVSVGYEIVRCPSLNKVRQLARNSDIVFQNNISMRTLVPLLSCRKPIVVAHQTWLTRTSGRRGWQDYLKLAALPMCHNIAISEAVAAALPIKSVVIGNPFDTGEFSGLQNSPRTKDIVFLGRLVSDKGCDLVLRSLSMLKTEGVCPSLSIIGDGPELPALRLLTVELGLSDQVVFLGSIREGRGREVAQHKIMVIPSRWAEPFGVVALEGVAAGCVVVASSAGGLPEAVGPCGILYPNGDVTAMASALDALLINPSLRQKLMSESARHLERFHPEAVAKKYLDVFRPLCAGSRILSGTITHPSTRP